MISETGVWSSEEQGAHIFSYGVARWVAKNIKGSFFDFGAGKGTYTEYLKDMGINCVGLDGFAYDGMIQQDLSVPFILSSKGNILCLEVFEHLPQQYEPTLLDNIINHCDGKLILSVAVEGQSGLGHVNCRSNIYVIDKLQERGMKFLPKETLEIRAQAEDYVSYFRNTLMVFSW